MAPAHPCHAPARQVLFMEDRAQVERSGAIDLPAGRHQVEIGGISPAAVDRSLRVEVTGATVQDARITRAWRPRGPGGLRADATELKRRSVALEHELEEATDAQERLSARAQHLAALNAEIQRALEEQAGAGASHPERWEDELNRGLEARRALAKEQHAAALRVKSVRRSLEDVQTALRTTEGPEQALTASVVLTVEGASGPVSIQVRYLVPCAAWRPAYRATLKGTSVLVECEAVAWQRTDEDWAQVALAFSTARPTLGTAPPRLSEDRLATRPKASEEKRHVDVTLREERIQSTGEAGAPLPTLPGLDDGGEVRLLAAPGRTDLPSDGLPHRIPLFSFEAEVNCECLCTPELGPTATLVARFANTSPHVLLAGPVDLVRQSGFIGRGSLTYTAPGEPTRLGFGTVDGLRVVRTVEETRDEARLTGRRTVRKHIAWAISNASREPARLILEERVPVSEVKEVEIQVLTRDCVPSPTPPSRDGILRAEVELAAGGTFHGRLVWELSAASRVSGV